MRFLGTRNALVVFFAAAMLMAIVAAPAQAANGSIYQACRDGAPMGGFSKSELQGALGGVPADLDEYYGCSAQISAAIVAKATKNLPGSTGASGVKGARAALRNADANDLTTPAERKKIASAIEEEVAGLSARPLTASTDPSVYTAPGKTLASTTAAGTPTALIIGVFGLLLLIGADLLRRLGRSPRASKFLPWSGQSGSD